jgi:predicted permease
MVLFLGLTPALLVSSTDLSTSLRGRSDNAPSRRLANAFVVVQFAVALGLVSAGGLLLESLTVLENVELGFDAEGVQSLYVALPDTRYRGADAERQFRRRALEELRAIPGVSSVDTASHLPMTPMTLDLATAIEGRPLPRGTLRAAPVFVSHGLLRTLGIPIRRGRGFDERDSKNSPWVIVVNERMAGVFWPSEEAVGRRVRLEYPWAPDAPLTVVGVVSDVKQEGVGHAVRPSFYILHEQFPQEWFYFAIRASDNVVSSVRARLAAMDASLPMTDVKTMSERVADSLAEHRARTQLVGVYAAAGLVLAAFGLYGTLASLVSQRTKELVIRMALGATTADITRLVLGHGVRQLAAGITLGLALALLGGRFVESLLYEVGPMDSGSLLITISLLAGAGLLAALVPARRAARLELATRLRQD